MKMNLEVCSELRALHSLIGKEVPHAHIWKISVCFSAPFPLQSDRVLDLVVLQESLDSILQKFQNTYLNETLDSSPTSENLAVFLWEQMAKRHDNVTMEFVKVALCNLEGDCMGIATLTS